MVHGRVVLEGREFVPVLSQLDAGSAVDDPNQACQCQLKGVEGQGAMVQPRHFCVRGGAATNSGGGNTVRRERENRGNTEGTQSEQVKQATQHKSNKSNTSNKSHKSHRSNRVNRSNMKSNTVTQ